MRTKSGFELRDVCGEQVITASGVENINFCKIISLNPSAALLWKAVEGNEFDADTLVRLLIEEYEIDKKTAEDDVRALIAQWTEAGIVE